MGETAFGPGVVPGTRRSGAADAEELTSDPTSAARRHLTAESKIRLPNVEEALNLGYAMHSADDPALEGKLAQDNARLVVKTFLELEAEPGTPEEAYLTCVRAIVHTHARGITRKKEQYVKDLRSADLRRRQQRLRIRESRRSNDWLNMVWRLLAPAILGLTGWLFAHFLGFFVPEEVSAQTGSRIPAVLMGLVFIAIGRSVSFWLSDLKRSAIETEYNSRVYQAFLSYEIGKLTEYRQYHKQLCEAWLQYAGEAYPMTASYEMVMEGDIETRKKLERHLQVYSTGYVRFLLRVIRILRGRRKTAA